MPQRRLFTLLIAFALELILFGCALTQPLRPTRPTPTAAPQPTQDLTARPYAGDMKATGQVMKATVFAQTRATPALFREKPALFSLVLTIPGILIIILGVAEIRHYVDIRRRRWAAGVSYEGFNVRVGVTRGKQAVQGAKSHLWAAYLWLGLGIFITISGLLVAFLN